MDIKEALILAIDTKLPLFRSRLETIQQQYKSIDLSFDRVLGTFSKVKYNISKEFGLSATNTRKFSKEILPERIPTSGKLHNFILDQIEYKICTHCMKAKPFSEFRKNKGLRHGLNTYCTECHLETTSSTQAARQSVYRANKLKATPLWADLDAISLIYKQCPKNMVIDHIVPLNGINVCGLHVENNLQELLPQDNNRKNNSFDIDAFSNNERWYEINTDPLSQKYEKKVSTTKEKYSKEYIEQIIWQYPFITGAKLVNLSDNGLRKLAKRLGCLMPPPRFHTLAEKTKLDIKNSLIPKWTTWSTL